MESHNRAGVGADGARARECDYCPMFSDRRQAGRLLAQLVERFASEQPVVLGLPRGGVPVGVEVARALHAPFDALVVRKLGAPGNPELAVGALAEGATAAVDRSVAASVGMTRGTLLATIERESRELQGQISLYRRDRPLTDIRGRVVILVDDGLATGLTQIAAIRATRALGARKIVVAVPVGARGSVTRVAAEADELICHTVPRELLAVSCWYHDFTPVGDDEVLRLLATATHISVQPAARASAHQRRSVAIAVDRAVLKGELVQPDESRGLVLFVHGYRSSARSTRNRAVAADLNEHGFATLLLDLVAADEARRGDPAFEITELAHRLELATIWAHEDPDTAELPIGYLASSTGAAVALLAAAALGESVRAVVARGGRPDLAGVRLRDVKAPTLLIVGSLDHDVLLLNERAAKRLGGPHLVVAIENATHLFGEPGKLEQVEVIARDWFAACLPSEAPALVAMAGS